MKEVAVSRELAVESPIELDSSFLADRFLAKSEIVEITCTLDNEMASFWSSER